MSHILLDSYGCLRSWVIRLRFKTDTNAADNRDVSSLPDVGGGGDASTTTRSLWRNVLASVALITALRTVYLVFVKSTPHSQDRFVVVSFMKENVHRWEGVFLAEVLQCCSKGVRPPDDEEKLREMFGEEVARHCLQLWDAHSSSSSNAVAAAPSSPPSSTESADARPVSSGDSNGFHGMSATFAFATDFDLDRCLSVCTVGDSLLTLEGDREWLRRLTAICKYAVFRRMALMEEARYYARLWRYTVLAPTHDASRMAPLRRGCKYYAAWRVYGRPSWLVPCEHTTSDAVVGGIDGGGGGAGTYLCLPLSYFPVECVQAPTSELENSLRHCSKQSSIWTVGSREQMQHLPRVMAHYADHQGDYYVSNCPAATPLKRLASQCAVDYWYEAYALPMARQREVILDQVAKEYMYELLLKQVVRSSGRGTDEDLYDYKVATDLEENLRTRHGIRVQTRPAEGKKEVLKLVMQVLLFRGISSALGVVFPDLSWNSMSLYMLWSVLPRDGGACAPTTTTAPSSLTTSLTPTSSNADDNNLARANALALQLLGTCGASLARVFLKRLMQEKRDALEAHLLADLEPELRARFLNADEAFLCRLTNLQSSSPTSGSSGGADDKDKENVRCDGEALRFESDLGDGIHSVATTAAHSALYMAEEKVGTFFTITALVLVSLYKRHLPLLLYSFALSKIRTVHSNGLLGKILNMRDDDYSEDVLLVLKDMAPAAKAPVGLKLLLDVLADAQADSSDCEATTHEAGGATSCRYPFLSLVTCSAIGQHQYLKTADVAEEVRRQRVEGVYHLYRAVLSYDYEGSHMCGSAAPSRVKRSYYGKLAKAGVKKLRSMAVFSRQGRRTAGSQLAPNDLVECLRLDADCHYNREVLPVYQSMLLEGALHDNSNINQKESNNHKWNKHLDATERAILSRPTAMEYLPGSIDSNFLFRKPTRFILKQLGLDLVFAQVHLRNPKGSMRSRYNGGGVQLLNVFIEGPLTCFVNRWECFLESLCTILCCCSALNAAPLPDSSISDGAGIWAVATTALKSLYTSLPYLQPRHSSSVLRDYIAVEGYVDCIDDASIFYSFDVTERRLYDSKSFLYMPTTIADTSDYVMHSPALQHARDAWREYLSTTHPVGEGKASHNELRFDSANRIVGGLRLQEGVGMHHVYFAYPQLHHIVEKHNGSSTASDTEEDSCKPKKAPRALRMRPALRDISFRFPADGMTAVIGPTGSGKSSLMRILKRLYDPLPVLRIASNKASAYDQTEPWFLSDEVVEKCMLLQWLPQPLPPSTESMTNTHHDVSHFLISVAAKGYMSFDGIPSFCLSTTYQRQWLSHLPQSPLVLSDETFLSNILGLSEDANRSDAVMAARVCRCEDFINKRPQSMDSVMGPLSGGETQRIGLARVVAAAAGRARREQLAEVMRLRPSNNSNNNNANSNRNCDTLSLNSTMQMVMGALLLDEPTSKLDAYNELKVHEAIQSLLPTSSSKKDGIHQSTDALPSTIFPAGSFMIVAIAHRLSTVSAAQHMLVVEGGSVAAEGSRHDVMRVNAFAKAQYELQTVEDV